MLSVKRSSPFFVFHAYKAHASSFVYLLGKAEPTRGGNSPLWAGPGYAVLRMHAHSDCVLTPVQKKKQQVTNS